MKGILYESFNHILPSSAPLIRPVGHLLPRFRERRDMIQSFNAEKSFPAARLIETEHFLNADERRST